tara:strand:- start:337 stop:774 length:438 start_codon:yes stop_codon:yes gene_type:complete
MQDLTQKRCSKCGKTFPATREFFPHRGDGSGKFKPNCRECERAYVKAWRKKNPKKASEGYKRRQKLVDGWAPNAQQKIELYGKANGHCRYCNAALGKDAEVDHAIPLTRGGTHEMSNLDLICPGCNGNKHAKTPEEYVLWLKRAA